MRHDARAPFRLDEGLYLERRGTMLPWYESLFQITGHGGTVAQARKGYRSKGGIVAIRWESEQALGGLAVSVVAYPDAHFYLQRIRADPSPSAREEYPRCLEELTTRLGDPPERGILESQGLGYPYARWRWGDVAVNLGIGERFVEYVALSVCRRPPGADHL